MTTFELPPDAYPLLDAELQNRLAGIRGNEADKKRYTALLYGVARATPGVREDSIFVRTRADSEMICARSVWYGKWKKVPQIRAVWEYVEELTRLYRDAETLRIEIAAHQLLRRSIAEGMVDAMEGLRQTALNPIAPGNFRTEASKTILGLGDEGMAKRLALLNARSLPVEIMEQPEQVVKLDVSSLSPELLRAIVDEGATAATTAGCPPGVGEKTAA